MAKVSPVAEYLTKNKAITKRDGNVCHFFSKDGLYIGKQVKIDLGTSTAYAREIYGEGYKKLFYECKVLGQKCAYFKDDKYPVGMGIMPTQTSVITHFVDFIANKVVNKQILKEIKSRIKLIAIDENTNVGLFYAEKPFKYSEEVIDNKVLNLKKQYQIKHTIH